MSIPGMKVVQIYLDNEVWNIVNRVAKEKGLVKSTLIRLWIEAAASKEMRVVAPRSKVVTVGSNPAVGNPGTAGISEKRK